MATSGFASKLDETCDGPAIFVDLGSCRTVIFPYSSPASELTTARAVKFSRPPLGTNGVYRENVGLLCPGICIVK